MSSLKNDDTLGLVEARTEPPIIFSSSWHIWPQRKSFAQKARKIFHTYCTYRYSCCLWWWQSAADSFLRLNSYISVESHCHLSRQKLEVREFQDVVVDIVLFDRLFAIIPTSVIHSVSWRDRFYSRFILQWKRRTKATSSPPAVAATAITLQSHHGIHFTMLW